MVSSFNRHANKEWNRFKLMFPSTKVSMPVALQPSLPPEFPQVNQELRSIMLILGILQPCNGWLQFRGPKEVFNDILLQHLKAQLGGRPPELFWVRMMCSHPTP